MNIDFVLNSERVSVEAAPTERLSDILHDGLGMQSVRSGCKRGRCGSCLVFMNGRVVPACVVPAFALRDQEILTLEGFCKSDDYRDIARAFERAGVEACEYCYSGKVLSVEEILLRTQAPDEQSIIEGMSGVSCGCTEMGSLVRAVEIAMKIRRERLYGGDR
jgi:aerobic carbon-monoxide dehydrogenase small subunit